MNVVQPEAGAVHVHQTDWPPATPAWFGSPGSFDAEMFVPRRVTLVPVMTMRLAKLSFTGGGVSASVSVKVPELPL